MSFCLILLAGGNSSRFNSNLPKPYHKIAGKTLLEISLNKSLLFNQIKKTVVVYNKKHEKVLKRTNLKKVKFITLIFKKIILKYSMDRNNNPYVQLFQKRFDLIQKSELLDKFFQHSSRQYRCL